MAASIAAPHTWQHRLAADSESPRMDNSSNGPARTAQDSTDVSNQVPTSSSASSVGHGQSTGGQYVSSGPFPAPISQWTPSPNAAPFYPQFPPFFHAATPPVAPQPQYFDPNQQIAWAYQQMMLQQAAIAHQHQQNHFNQAMAEFGRVRANSGTQQNDFFSPQSVVQAPLIPGFPFQSGTPPAHPTYNGPPQSFRRGPQAQHHMPGPRSNTFDSHDWGRLTAQNIPVPYARPDAAGSSHSVSSSNGSGPASASGARQRTISNNTNGSQTPPGSLRGQPAPNRSASVPQLTTDFERPRQVSQSRQNSSGPPSPASHARSLHQRNTSGSSDRAVGSARGPVSNSSVTSVSSNNTATASSGAASSSVNTSPTTSFSRTNQRAPAKPSPLSQQQTFPDAVSTPKRVKRLSKDDSELLPQTTVASALTPRQSGLKGRFKRALTFNPPSSVDEHGDGGSSISHGDSSPNPNQTPPIDGDAASSPVTPVNAGESVRSTKPKSRAAALFSGKFNASTDNISLQSTVSSASVMIRKLGSIGKLARRNSLMSITGIFKDKNKEKSEVSGKKSKKSEKAEPSVSHVTVETDRGGGSDDESLNGLTPAARVARQHTLKTKAEAARRLREQAAAANVTTAPATNGASVPAWEKNTTNRRQENVSRGASEDGTLNEGKSDDGSGEGGYDPQFDDSTLRIPGGPLVEEDEEEPEEGDEPWAVGVRRSIERSRQPGRSVIKNHKDYIQEQYLDPPNQPFASRIRSNSYQTVAESLPGPLAHLPPPDPGQIDGLQRSNSTGNTPEKKPFSLPAFDFQVGEGIDILPRDDTEDTLSSTSHALANQADKGPTFAYTHPTANSSAPALSTIPNPGNGVAAGQSATGNSLKGMKKSISFAATLSIYDTFSSTAYDRRSEPSTANRLTPALAQRIKEELNSYKMEEMEVHFASRVHTHFFV
ncbi:hypothetical protein FRC14_002139 [Serendipita sp. 396]|nr:hypothetical protein FRC14_002139 [Serendipita sp. 396]KAG8785477.1 hypothetical protein FRC15_001284 [Serendipita sp. 397]KAG8834468.1 hypothetical protein FRC18_001985 [Serendipita sp. 400]KAG8859968.1 hypothetical protein FRB91_005566 [Serendipita sp. 411]KAG8869357.1 hypothetical protein FRC20_001575 [Serendipita sp. 405]